MSKSDITQEQVLSLCDRVAQELGLLRQDTSGFFMWKGPTNKHRLYVQKSQKLNRIDVTFDLPSDDPMYKQITSTNGSIKCHIVPTLENLERALRMLGDASLGTQTPNKPRPFAATKAPPARKPKPVEEPTPEVKLNPVPQGGSLADRLEAIREASRISKVRRIMEDPEKYGEMTHAEAEELVDSKVSLEEYARKRKQKPADIEDVGVTRSLDVVIAEAGLDDVIADAMN